MTEYADYVRDFPGRCLDVLEAFSEPAAKLDREVTLLLMAAGTAFVVPLGRLRECGHPQPGLDRILLTGTQQSLEERLNETIGDSTLFQDPPVSWRGSELESADGDPEQWPEFQAGPLPGTMLVREAILPLRHALAHGNIQTRANPAGEIVELVFTAGGGDKTLSFRAMSPQVLRQFILNWFRLLTTLGLPNYDAQEVLRHVAA